MADTYKGEWTENDQYDQGDVVTYTPQLATRWQRVLAWLRIKPLPTKSEAKYFIMRSPMVKEDDYSE